MNWNQVEGYWTQLTGRIRETWGVVTHRPLDVAKGRHAQVVGRLQRRYGVAEASHDTRLPIFESTTEAS